MAWGIFDSIGNPVLEADSVFAVEYQHDYRISDYPQEQGAFQSYNQVPVPWVAKITFLVSSSREGSVAGLSQVSNVKRGLFLSQAENAAFGLTLYTVVTPEFAYVNANVIHVSYRRIARQSVSMLMVDVWCEEVRVIGQGFLSNTQSTNGAGPLNSGPVQTDVWQQTITATPPT